MRVLVTNDDGVEAPGVHALTVAIATGGVRGIRFGRLGTACQIGSSTSVCPALTSDPGGSFYVNPSSGDMVITVTQTSTGLSRTVRVAPGGRVVVR